MKDYEYRCLEEFLRNNGVECHRYGGRSKEEALRQHGIEILFSSIVGEILFSGEDEILVLSRKKNEEPPSLALRYAIRKFGQEMVRRQNSSRVSGLAGT